MEINDIFIPTYAVHPFEILKDGTIVLVRVPTNVPDSFQYLNYIERL